MASGWQNFELGIAGLTDEAFGTTYAAKVYAAQTPGADLKSTVAAEKAGAVDEAAQQTTDKVAGAVGALGAWTKWIVVGLVAVAAIAALVELGPVIRKVAR